MCSSCRREFLLKVRLSLPGPCGLSAMIGYNMKMNRLLPFVLSVSLFAHALGAAGYEPTTSWPYIYEQFMPGHIKTHQGGDISYDKLNVNLVSGRVHYVEDLAALADFLYSL